MQQVVYVLRRTGSDKLPLGVINNTNYANRVFTLVKFYVLLCEAVRNRECGGLCVGVRGPGSRAVAPRKEGGRCGARGRVSSMIFSGVVGLLFSVGSLFF